MGPASITSGENGLFIMTIIPPEMPGASYMIVPRGYFDSAAVGIGAATFDICEIAEAGEIAHVVRVSVTGWTTGPRTASTIEPSSWYV
jgi:hypothetical protein